MGTACLQVARAMGAGTLIALASDERKRRVALDAGADHALDPAGDWVAEVRALTDGRGADIPSVPANTLLLRPGGFAPLQPSAHPPDTVGVNYGGMLPVDGDFARRAADELVGWVRDGTIAPVVGERRPLQEAPALLRAFADRTATGKPVLLMR